ncbi:hypothetical protein ACFYOK_07205 [Microbispora bryophytorum]|uniref:hypothetical protein n=1 Tax=Microbispora bryophytorum TaxID=1460882 RepID=UPI0033F1D0F8
MHLHCYVWSGIGAELRNEAERRPPLPPADPGPFTGSPLPPMRTCDWLLKPARRIDASPASPDEALAWLAERYQSMEGSFLRPADEARIGLGFRLETAREALHNGVDVQWGIWLTGGRFLTCGVVCCSPNHHADYRCPAS